MESRGRGEEIGSRYVRMEVLEADEVEGRLAGWRLDGCASRLPGLCGRRVQRGM